MCRYRNVQDRSHLFLSAPLTRPDEPGLAKPHKYFTREKSFARSLRTVRQTGMSKPLVVIFLFGLNV